MDATTSNPEGVLQFTYTLPGSYPAIVTITDEQNLVHTENVVIVVHGAGH